MSNQLIDKTLLFLGKAIRGGVVTFPEIASQGYADVAVTFTNEMNGTPVITAIRVGAGASGYHLVFATTDRSRNGSTLRCWNYGPSAVTPKVQWIAVTPIP